MTRRMVTWVDPPPRRRADNDDERRSLLRWAVNHIEVLTNGLEECHKDGDGNIRPGHVVVELRRCRAWIKRARAMSR